MYSDGWGHYQDGTIPDRIDARRSLAMDYCRDLLDLLALDSKVDPSLLLDETKANATQIPPYQQSNYPEITEEQIQQWMERLEKCISGK